MNTNPLNPHLTLKPKTETLGDETAALSTENFNPPSLAPPTIIYYPRSAIISNII
jgi:hypothetical protein